MPTDPMTNTDDLEQAWEHGEPVDVSRRRPPTSVLSVRLPHEVLRELEARARELGKSPSGVARDFIEHALDATGPLTPEALAKLFSRWVEEATESSGAPRSERPVGSVNRPVRRRAYPSVCTACGGRVTERCVTVVYPASGGPRIVHDVPTGVCDQCGEQYLRAEVAARVEELLSSAPHRREELPAWDYAAAE